MSEQAATVAVEELIESLLTMVKAKLLMSSRLNW